MTVLLTRTIKDSTDLAKQLEAYNINSYIEPMFNMEYLDCNLDSADLSSSQAVIFTSKNALYAIKNVIQKFAHLKCFVVGNATAKAAKRFKFKDVYIANNSAKSLADLILAKTAIKDGKLLYFCGELVTLDFKEELEKHGYNVQKFCVYKTVALKEFSPELKDKINNNQIKTMLLYSSNTAEIFLDLIKQNDMLSCLSGIDVFVISKKVKPLVDGYKWKSISVFDVDQPEKIIEKIRHCYEANR